MQVRVEITATASITAAHGPGPAVAGTAIRAVVAAPSRCCVAPITPGRGVPSRSASGWASTVHIPGGTRPTVPFRTRGQRRRSRVAAKPPAVSSSTMTSIMVLWSAPPADAATGAVPGPPPP